MITKALIFIVTIPIKTILFLFSPKAFKKSITNIRIGYLRDKNDRHPHLIMDEVDDKYISMGLSTEPRKGKNKKAGKNKPLQINPLGGNDKSYMRRKATIENKKRYEKIQQGKIHTADYDVAKYYSDIAKDAYNKKK